MTFFSAAVIAAGFLCPSGLQAVQSTPHQRTEVQHRTSGERIELAQAGCNLKDKSKCPMEPMPTERAADKQGAIESTCNLQNKAGCEVKQPVVRLTSDGKILGPTGKTILKAGKPIMLKAPDGKDLLMVTRKGKVSECCSLSLKTCCPITIEGVSVVSISSSGDLVGPSGQTIFKANEAYAIKGPNGELVYDHAKTGQ